LGGGGGWMFDGNADGFNVYGHLRQEVYCGNLR
jgi:hypothetical protein